MQVPSLLCCQEDLAALRGVSTHYILLKGSTQAKPYWALGSTISTKNPVPHSAGVGVIQLYITSLLGQKHKGPTGLVKGILKGSFLGRQSRFGVLLLKGDIFSVNCRECSCSETLH